MLMLVLVQYLQYLAPSLLAKQLQDHVLEAAVDEAVHFLQLGLTLLARNFKRLVFSYLLCWRPLLGRLLGSLAPSSSLSCWRCLADVELAQITCHQA